MCIRDRLQQFDDYYRFLVEKNKVMNLTTIIEKEDVVLKHFIDSIYIMKYTDFDEKKVIDIGTGAGFPGIPLAIMNQMCIRDRYQPPHLQ